MKTCTQCKLQKYFSDFSPKGNGKFASRCKTCLAQNRRTNYVKHSQTPLVSNIKQCQVCLLDKPINEFYKNYNCLTFRNECKACNRLRTEKRRKELREFSAELKDVPCMDCNEKYPYYVMDFDHRDGSTKEYNLSQMRFTSKENFLKEASKCDVVCANCHRERTFNRIKENK